MNSINPKNFFKPYEQGVGGSRGVSQLVNTPTSQDISTDLMITTQEGDKVTLKSVVGRDLTIDYDKKEIVEGTKNRIWISVEGELSDEELADINKALDTIEQSMTNLISGNLEGIINADSVNLEEMENIQSFSGELKQLDIQEGPLSEEDLNKSFKMNSNIVRKHFGLLGDNLIESVKDTPIKPEQFISPVNKMVTEAFNENRNKEAFVDAHMNLIKEIHTNLLEKLSTTSENFPHIISQMV